MRPDCSTFSGHTIHQLWSQVVMEHRRDVTDEVLRGVLTELRRRERQMLEDTVLLQELRHLCERELRERCLPGVSEPN
jgi:hypothetical protein